MTRAKHPRVSSAPNLTIRLGTGVINLPFYSPITARRRT